MQSGKFQTILKSMAGLDMDNCTLSWKAETIRSKGCLGSGQALHIEMNIKIDLCQSQNLALSFWPDHGEGGGGGGKRVNVFCHRGKELSLHLELSFWKQKSFTEMMPTCSLLLERASSSFFRFGGARLTRCAWRLVEATWKNPGEKEGTWKNPGENMQSGKVH